MIRYTIIIICIFFMNFLCKSQIYIGPKDVNGINLCEAHNMRIQWYYLVKVSSEEEKGYILASTWDFDKLDENIVHGENASCEEIFSLFQRPPYREKELNFHHYDYGFISSKRLVRFDSIETCELAKLYFDENGYPRELGLIQPVVYAYASLIKRGVIIHGDDYVGFIIDWNEVCPD